MSEQADTFLLKLDLSGISVMIAGSTTPAIYYGFYCEETTYYRNLYLALVWGSNTLALLYVLNPPFKFESHSLRMVI
jgi:predicted membrane channel-forming protein YqfA (hemolysin III family)